MEYALGRTPSDKVSKLLCEFFGIREQYCEECYNTLLDSGFATKTECIRHKYDNYVRIEKELDKGDYGTIIQYWKTYADSDTEPAIILLLHEVYNFTKDTVINIANILGRAIPKRRSLVLYGKSNTGKSLLGNAIVYPFACGYIQRDGGTNVHWLEHIYHKSFILWEEPSIHLTNIEDTKLLLGGEKIVINRKNKSLLERINSPAVVVTTNRPFWEYERDTIDNRIFRITLTNIFPDNITIQPRQILQYLICLYDGRIVRRSDTEHTT